MKLGYRRECPTCGAKVGEPCRFDDDDLEHASGNYIHIERAPVHPEINC